MCECVMHVWREGGPYHGRSQVCVTAGFVKGAISRSNCVQRSQSPARIAEKWVQLVDNSKHLLRPLLWWIAACVLQCVLHRTL